MLNTEKKLELISAIENIVQKDVGRNINALFNAAKGNLGLAAASIAEAEKPYVGIITGFYIPAGNPPAGETDGPLGAALLMAGLKQIGIECRLITDELCRNVCMAALKGAGVRAQLDVIGAESIDAHIKTWKQAGVTHALSIERCGRSADGSRRNMRTIDISSYTPPLDELFLDGSWTKLAIGDGGNEIGMGSIPKQIIADNVAHGANIACVTPADHLIVVGVSNWGGYALLGALAVYREEWREKILEVLREDNNQRILETMVKEGPAVDGVTHEQCLSVDGMPLERHNDVINAIRQVISSKD